MSQGDYVISSGGGARVLYIDALKEKVVETGISTLSGFGQYPTPLSTYRAMNQAMKMRPPYNETQNVYGKRWHREPNPSGIIVRITGVLGDMQNDDRYIPEEGAEYTTMSRRINAYIGFDELNFIRFNPGDGSGDLVPSEEEQVSYTGFVYPNVYIRVMSEMTGFNWSRIDTVQFFY